MLSTRVALASCWTCTSQVLRGAGVALFGAPQALHDRGQVVAAAWFAQASLELAQRGLKAAGLGRVDGAILLLARWAVAVQQQVAVRVHDAVKLDRHVAGGLHFAGLGWVELALAQPRHDHVVVALLAQPGQVGLGGDARVHHHRGPGLCLQAAKHVGQRRGLAGVAGKYLAAAHEAAAVEHQRQGHQRAVAAALLAVPALGLAHASSGAFEVGVGQVVQRDRLAQAEQRLGLCKQVLLQGHAVPVQRVRGPVQAAQIHRLEVKAQQLAQPRVLLQPSVAGQLAARAGHAGDDVAHGRGDLRRVQPQLDKLGLKPALAHRRQPRVLHPHAARAHQFQRVQIDILEALNIAPARRQRWRASTIAGRRAQGQQLRGIALRQYLAFIGQHGIGHSGLAMQQILNALDQRGPLRLRQIKVRAQVEQGGLAYRRACSYGLNQTKRRIDLARSQAAGLSAPDEHLPMLHQDRPKATSVTKYYGTTNGF